MKISFSNHIPIGKFQFINEEIFYVGANFSAFYTIPASIIHTLKRSVRIHGPCGNIFSKRQDIYCRICKRLPYAFRVSCKSCWDRYSSMLQATFSVHANFPKSRLGRPGFSSTPHQWIPAIQFVFTFTFLDSIAFHIRPSPFTGLYLFPCHVCLFSLQVASLIPFLWTDPHFSQNVVQKQRFMSFRDIGPPNELWSRMLCYLFR